MSNIQIATETNELISSNGENHNNNNHFDKQICFQHFQNLNLKPGPKQKIF